MKEKFSVKVLAEIAIFAAIGYVLCLLQNQLFKAIWVNGGAIGIAMVPVFIIAYRRGLVAGILCGLVLSVVQMIGTYIYITPMAASYNNKAIEITIVVVQVSLDYILGYTVVGFAGAFSGLYKRSKSLKGRILWMIVGVVVGGLLKYICHVLAGYFWLNPEADGIWGVPNGTMLYSFVYNLCVVFSMIACIPVMLLIVKFYPKFLNVHHYDEEDEALDLKAVEPAAIESQTEEIIQTEIDKTEE